MRATTESCLDRPGLSLTQHRRTGTGESAPAADEPHVKPRSEAQIKAHEA